MSPRTTASLALHAPASGNRKHDSRSYDAVLVILGFFVVVVVVAAVVVSGRPEDGLSIPPTFKFTYQTERKRGSPDPYPGSGSSHTVHSGIADRC